MVVKCRPRGVCVCLQGLEQSALRHELSDPKPLS